MSTRNMCLERSVEVELRSMPGNNICCDCNDKNPQWASVSFGIFMCLECSGRHRALGVHISFVRSVTMDSWTEKQISMMKAGGNDKCNAFLSQHGVAKNTAIAIKYNSPPALLYRDRISATIEGRPLPTQLPAAPAPASSSTSSEALPGESEAEYVARQRRLQEEARERMRAKFGASNGLNANGSGKMQGIGSDSSYRGCGGGGGGGGVSTAEVTAQIADVSQKALSYVQQFVRYSLSLFLSLFLLHLSLSHSLSLPLSFSLSHSIYIHLYLLTLIAIFYIQLQ